MTMQPHPKTTLTLGQFIMQMYDTCAASQAGALVRLALETQRVLVAGNPWPHGPPHGHSLSPVHSPRPGPLASRFQD